MSMRHLMVLDIDRTLLKKVATGEGTHMVKRIAEHHRCNGTLVYVTSLSFQSVWTLVTEGVLPRPAAVAASVGTEVWFPEWTRPDPFYQEFVRHNWNRDMIISFAKSIPGLVLQEEPFQSLFKVRFHILKKFKLFDVRQMLHINGIDVRVTYFLGCYLDVVPRYAGKQKAIEFLSHYFRVKPHNVMTCNNSESDQDRLCNPNTLNTVSAYHQNVQSLIRHHLLPEI